jgi:hypothetical protein
VSVADTISETFNGGDNESEESTNIAHSDTTVIPSHDVKSFTTVQNEEEKFLPTANDENLTTESKQEETTEFITISSSDESADDITTEAVSDETTSSISDLSMEPKEKDEMVQLSFVRKEESLERVDLVTHSSQEKSTDGPNIDEGNFIKIETISTTPSVQKLSGFKNKTTLIENARPTYITQRSTTTTDIVPNDQPALQPKHDEEPITERVPLIEKASKESSTASIPLTTEHNLVQIKVQTKPTITLPSSTTEMLSTTVSNAQNIKNTIKNAQAQQMQQSRPVPIELSTAPQEALGLAASTVNISKDLSDFSKLCNELAFTFWKSITADGISQSRSVVISPFALTSTLSMIFLGARGQTSGEMNDLLRLDDTVTFNPHVVFRNISESIEQSRNSGIAAAAFARELYSDRSKGKLLPYFKEKAQQFYGAHVEEVNFNVVNDILRRRTNLLVKKHTYNKIKEYLKTNNIWVNEPLAAVSANVFMVSA